jgi:outer membrane immunogenic protein
MTGRTKWLALTSAALMMSPAAAQAQQASPAYNWSGFYIGLNAGGAWGRSDTTTSTGSGTYFAEPEKVAAAGTGSLSGSGFTGGVQAGYNWQSSNVVYGLEADFGAFNVGATRQTTVPYAFTNEFVVTNATDTDWLFTARGRFGWVISNVLAYVTGGLAVARIDTANSYSDDVNFAPDPNVTGNWNASKTKLGWTLGGGFEFPLANNWTVKTEYLYLNFGSVHAAGMVSGGLGYSQGISTSTDLTAHIARAGVNFRF